MPWAFLEKVILVCGCNHSEKSKTFTSRRKNRVFVQYYRMLNYSFLVQANSEASSETQGQSVGSGERAGRKFSSTGERAPGYRLSPSYFQNLKRMPVPDWAQKMLSINWAQSTNSFSGVPLVSSYTMDCLAHAPKKCTQSGNFQFDVKSPSDFKILSARKL